MDLMYPWFLFGLLAISFPIVIHFLQLRKPQRVLFSNTVLVRGLELVTARQRRIKRWLLLLIRIFSIVALVFAFCQPSISNNNAKQNNTSSQISVFVDNSNSMQQASNTVGSLLEEAIGGARIIAKKNRAGRSFKLLDKNLRDKASKPIMYESELEALRIDAQAPQTLSRVQALKNDKNNETYIFSDFQKNAISDKFITSLSDKQRVALVPVVGKPNGNLYTDSVWLDDAVLKIQTNIGLHVRLRNGGSAPIINCPAKIYLGAKQVGVFQVTLRPEQVRTFVVQVQVQDGALAQGRVVTEDMPVTFDNTYYFTLQPSLPIRVLEIGNNPIVQQLYGNEPLFNYAFSKPEGLNYSVLQQANLVIVREVETVTNSLRDELKAVVKRGGSVVIVPAAVTAGHASYQELFRVLGLGGMQWEEHPVVPELREVAIPNAREPFFRDVFGAQQRAATMPRVAPVLRWTRTQTDLLKLRDGESYLAAFSSDNGRVYVFSAPFASAYSDFTAHALFVPVMYRMAMLSHRNEQLPAYRLTQPAVTLQLPAGGTGISRDGAEAQETSFRLVKDSLTLIPKQRVIGEKLQLDVSAEMNEPGFYQMQYRGKVLTTLAFNQDKRESELAAYSADELRNMIGPNRPNIQVLESGTGSASLAKYNAEQTAQPLWRYCLMVVLMCLLAEALLIRFGREGKGQGKLMAQQA